MVVFYIIIVIVIVIIAAIIIAIYDWCNRTLYLDITTQYEHRYRVIAHVISRISPMIMSSLCILGFLDVFANDESGYVVCFSVTFAIFCLAWVLTAVYRKCSITWIGNCFFISGNAVSLVATGICTYMIPMFHLDYT